MNRLERIRAGATALAVAAALATPAAAAEPGAVQVAQASTEIYGTWFRTVRPGGVRLTDDAQVAFLGTNEWAETAANCTSHFEHGLEAVDADALFARLTEGNPLDNDDVPIAAALQGRLPEGTVTALSHSCCCVSEISGSVTYVLVAPDRLLSVAFGDGIYAIEDLQSEPPLVPPQTLDQETREAIQQALTRLGFYADEVDGMFGPASRSAISDFQESLGDEPTGVLNRQQLDILLNG